LNWSYSVPGTIAYQGKTISVEQLGEQGIAYDNTSLSLPDGTPLVIAIHGTNDNPISAPVHTTTPVSTLGFAPSISADGTHIAYSTSDGHVFLYDRITNTGNSTPIDPSQPGEIYSSASISPDGRFVVFQGTDAHGANPEIFVYDRDAPNGHGGFGIATLLEDPTTHIPISGTNPQISADGQFIALVQSAQVLVADRNGTIIDTISAGNQSGNVDVLNPAISPDGRLITFLSTGSSVTVEVNHGTPATLAAPDGAGGGTRALRL
jgi:dipeptidyl aminopeptidase/acylaminoacyl peptidase